MGLRQIRRLAQAAIVESLENRWLLSASVAHARHRSTPVSPLADESISASTASTASISGQVFVDKNSDGIYNGTDSPLPGLSVYLDEGNFGSFQQGDPTYTTDSTGGYWFANLPDNLTGTVRLMTPPTTGYVQVPTGGAGFNTASNPSTIIYFAYFPTSYVGAATSDNFVLQLDSSGKNIQVLQGGSVAFAAPKSLPSSLSFDLSAGAGSLIVLNSFGNPIPSGGLSFKGGSGDTLAVYDFADSNNIVVGASQVMFNASTINYTGAASIDFVCGSGNDTLTQTAQPGAPLIFNGGTGNDALDILGGTYPIAGDPIANGTQSLAVTVGGGSGPASVTFAGDAAAAHGSNPYHLASLSVATNGTATLLPPASGLLADSTLLTTSSLSITGGKLNLTSNAVDVHYLGSSTGDPISLIATEIDGGAIYSSLPPDRIHGIGYADGADGVASGLEAGDILIKYTYLGDVNLDGSVNFDDLLILAQHFGQTGMTWDEGDFNGDGVVDFLDLLALAQQYGK